MPRRTTVEVEVTVTLVAECSVTPGCKGARQHGARFVGPDDAPTVDLVSARIAVRGLRYDDTGALATALFWDNYDEVYEAAVESAGKDGR